MTLQLYMDVLVPGAVTSGLRHRGVDVLTAQEDGYDGRDDEDLLDRATELRRIIFTQDHDFFTAAARRQRSSELFSGVFFAAQGRLSYRQCIEELELVAKCCDWAEWAGQINSIPLEG